MALERLLSEPPDAQWLAWLRAEGLADPVHVGVEGKAYEPVGGLDIDHMLTLYDTTLALHVDAMHFAFYRPEFFRLVPFQDDIPRLDLEPERFGPEVVQDLRAGVLTHKCPALRPGVVVNCYEWVQRLVQEYVLDVAEGDRRPAAP